MVFKTTTLDPCPRCTFSPPSVAGDTIRVAYEHSRTGIREQSNPFGRGYHAYRVCTSCGFVAELARARQQDALVDLGHVHAGLGDGQHFQTLQRHGKPAWFWCKRHEGPIEGLALQFRADRVAVLEDILEKSGGHAGFNPACDAMHVTIFPTTDEIDTIARGRPACYQDVDPPRPVTGFQLPQIYT